METMSKQFENISGVYSVTAPIEMTKTFVDDPAGRHQGRARSWCWC